MKLTGKCKGAFEKWYMNSSSIYFSAGYHEVLSRLYGVSHEGELSVFYHSPESMQYGVYVDWFDSVGVKIVVDFDTNKNKWFAWLLRNQRVRVLMRDNIFEQLFLESRPEARTAAIEKANEIYNER
tara:strand:- start:1906 stop:2283 length:378 start_codon:yes stop_codon:yes gene_type:complete